MSVIRHVLFLLSGLLTNNAASGVLVHTATKQHACRLLPCYDRHYGDSGVPVAKHEHARNRALTRLEMCIRTTSPMRHSLFSSCAMNFEVRRSLFLYLGTTIQRSTATRMVLSALSDITCGYVTARMHTLTAAWEPAMRRRHQSCVPSQ